MTIAMNEGRRVLAPERRFYLAMIVVIIATVLLGFSRSFFLRPLFPSVHAAPEMIFYVHGVVFTAWLGLLAVQASLISASNHALHMRLGLAAFVLVPVMIVLGTIASLVAARRPGGFIDIPAPPLEFLIVPIADIVVFAVLAGLALYFRGQPQAHKRLIILAAIALTEAGIVRWPFEAFLTNPPLAFWTKTILVVPLVVWDMVTLGRIHWATLAGGALLVAEGPVRDALSTTSGWLAFAKWMTGLLD